MDNKINIKNKMNIILDEDLIDDDSISNLSLHSQTDDNTSKKSISRRKNSELQRDEIEEEAERLHVSREFQEKVIKYVKFDDLIRKKEKEIKELKSQRKPCEEYILKYLEDIDENVIDVSGGKIRKNKYETKAAINQEIIKETLMEDLQDEEKIRNIIKKMDENRPKNTRINLKRTFRNKEK